MSQGRIEVNGASHQLIKPSDVAYWSRLPYTIRIMLENVLRNDSDHRDHWLKLFESWLDGQRGDVLFYPARVLMQDLTGVPALVDLTAMRDAMGEMGGDPSRINPRCGVDLVIDHSVTVDYARSPEAFSQNVALEVQKNRERYGLLKWSQNAFDHVQIVPPGKGICHQVNLEYLATVVTAKEGWVYPDTLVGLDSHTTMINGLGVLGWGVGGIEAEAAMLGQPVSLKLPDVVGVSLQGDLKTGVTATDLVLTVTERLRQHGVVAKFVEFCGEGAMRLSLAERATVANMAPEFGATCAFFAVDDVTLDYLSLTGRSSDQVQLVKQYLSHMELFGVQGQSVEYTEKIEIDMSQIQPCIAGPERPEQRIVLNKVKPKMASRVTNYDPERLSDGSVVIAAITSCTNTSNPSVLIGAGLLAQKANAYGLRVPDWVKPSFAPGSRVVVDYLRQQGLMEELERLGFYLVGFGCTTCIGNSGPLGDAVSHSIQENELTVCSVLSGNRNFEGRVHPETKLNFLASPALVVAYALAGTIMVDFDNEPLGVCDGRPIYLRDIWPSDQEIQSAMSVIRSEMFNTEYQGIFEGTADWREVESAGGEQYRWDQSSTYIRQPSFFDQMSLRPTPLQDVKGAYVLALLGDDVTTDHISPAGAIAVDSAAAKYLLEQGLDQKDLHSYGARRGNAEVMVRGTFANIRLANQMVSRLGGYTTLHPEGQEMSIYDAAMVYQSNQTPTVIFAGHRYGTGSSRDWAAKGTRLLGVQAVVAKSFERIHRSNLIGMGVLPCIVNEDEVDALKLNGSEIIDVIGIEQINQPMQDIQIVVRRPEETRTISAKAAINTDIELKYLQHGGILHYVLRQMQN